MPAYKYGIRGMFLSKKPSKPFIIIRRNTMEITTLITEEEIKKRVEALGKQIAKEHDGEELILLGALKGCVIFLSDLARHLPADTTQIDFFRVSSYKGTESTGIAKLIFDFTVDIRDKHVILVEDIIDTGTTLAFIEQHVALKAPKSFKVCTLLNKNKVQDAKIHYNGFDIPNKFVVGYGLDHDNRYRNLPYIGAIN